MLEIFRKQHKDQLEEADFEKKIQRVYWRKCGPLMSFLNYIKNSFPRVLAVDTEFRFKDESKTIIDEVVCVVFQDIFNPKDVFKVWTAGQKFSKNPFEFRDCLLVPLLLLKLKVFLTLFWGTPNNVWDVFVENSRLYKTFRSGKGALNLLTTANHYEIPEVMTKEQKRL